MVVLRNIQTYEDYTNNLFEQAKAPDNLTVKNFFPTGKPPGDSTVAAKDNVSVNNLGREMTYKVWNPITNKFVSYTYRPTTSGAGRVKSQKELEQDIVDQKNRTPFSQEKFSEDQKEGIHHVMAVASLVLAFCGPYGLAASSFLQVVDALVYFIRDKDNKMGILSLIFAAIPVISSGKLVFQGSKVIGVKGIMNLVSKFEFKGGKFFLKSGMAKTLTSDEKLLLLGFFKNKKIILQTIEGKAKLILGASSGILKSILKMVGTIIGLFLGSMVYSITWDMLVTPDMTEEQKQETKSIVQSLDEDVKAMREEIKKRNAK